MFSFLYSKPCKSRLNDKTYMEYKYGFEEALQRAVTFDLECPVIEFDDSKKHIILRSFRGCISENLIVVPDGITLVYVDNDDYNVIDKEKAYNLVLPDTVQSIDYLPDGLSLHFLDTNKLESIRLKDSEFNTSTTVDTVIVRDDFKFKSCIGHIQTMKVYYALDKLYKVDKTHMFLSDGFSSEIYVNENCKSVKLKHFNKKLYVYGENSYLRPSDGFVFDNKLSMKNVVQNIVNLELNIKPA